MSAGTEHSNGGVGIEDGTEPTVGRRAFVTGTIAAATAAGATAAGGSASAQGDAYQGWFEDVDNYEGTVDYRGQDEVTVAVGAGENGLFFEPAAILVDPGTTVVWEWTGQATPHNVVHEPAEEGQGPVFESELLEEEGATFEHTFDEVEEGILRYYCDPHRAVGMKGAVAVGNVDDELIDPSGGDGGGGSSQPLTTVDTILAVSGLIIGIALIFAVVRPNTLEPNRN